MDKVRILTRMGRQIANRTTSNSSMAHAERASTTVYAVAAVTSPSNGSPRNTTSSSARNNCSNSAFHSTLSTDLHKRTRETDVRTAGSDVTVTAGNHAKED